MKTYTWLTFLLICSFSAGAAEAVKPAHAAKPAKGTAKPAVHKSQPTKISTSASPLAAGPAEINYERVNARARPDVGSDVVAHLKGKDVVQVIEEVTPKSIGPGEPSRWAKIAWPDGGAVWVYADFLDQRSSTVKVAKLNLRGGPTENHSVVGTLERGASVKKLEAKGDWWKIEAPAGAVAYVASQFLTSKTPKDTVVVASAPVAVAPMAAPAPPAQVVRIPRPTLRPPPAAPVAVQVEENIVAVPAYRPLVAPLTALRPAPATPLPSPVVVAPPPKVEVAVAPARVPEVMPREPGQIDIRPISETAFVKRIVSRQGRVRRAWSIQSPTPLILENLHNGRLMNYLYSTSTNINLSMFRGQEVTVSGEEALDERWPNIPVIRVETLQTAP